jgi:hypothetical protein
MVVVVSTMDDGTVRYGHSLSAVLGEERQRQPEELC